MGEARRRRQMGLPPRTGANGGALVAAKRIRVVPNIRLEESAKDHVVIIMLGSAQPELGAAMTPDHCRVLAEALVKHADHLDPPGAKGPVILGPGGFPAT